MSAFNSPFGGSGKAKITPEGGVAILVTNKTGADSVKGMPVKADTSADNAIAVAGADSVVPIGVVYDSGIADGKDVWVIVSGIADVLFKDTVAPVRGYWVAISDASGRATNADHTGSTPPEQAEHNREIGHCIESKDAGTDVVAKCILHFN